MREERRVFMDVRIKELSYPVNVGSKFSYKEEFTIADINIKAKIEKKFRNEFEDEILRIINNREAYTGINELSSFLINYINSLNALTAEISFTYPYFMSKISTATKDISLMKYLCRYILKKESLIKYQKKFSVAVPVVMSKYIVPGYKNDIAEVSAKVIVEIEGFDIFFTEDITEVVEKNINNTIYNYGSSLIKNIEKDLRSKFIIDKCTVRVANQKAQSVEATRLEKVPETARDFHYNNYEGEHLFI